MVYQTGPSIFTKRTLLFLNALPDIGYFPIKGDGYLLSNFKIQGLGGCFLLQGMCFVGHQHGIISLQVGEWWCFFFPMVGWWRRWPLHVHFFSPRLALPIVNLALPIGHVSCGLLCARYPFYVCWRNSFSWYLDAIQFVQSGLAWHVWTWSGM